MSLKRVKFYGSVEDLYAFEKQLKDSGFDKCEDYPNQSSGFPPVPSISYNTAPEMAKCIKTILSTRHQRMAGKGKITIKGDLPADEIERLLAHSGYFDIQNEPG